MRILLDTHALLWWLANDHRLGEAARDLIADPTNDILVSVASLWEIVVKIRIGKLKADIAGVLEAADDEGFEFLDIQPEHLIVLEKLPLHHRDPFDHLLIAQAIADDLLLMTSDENVLLYSVQTVRC